MALYTRNNRVASELIYEGDIINFRVDSLELDSGKSCRRELVEHNGGVVIACQPTAETVVLIKQYRYSVDEELIELPAGRIELGEEPLLAAKRELTEETGYAAKVWHELSRMYTAPGFCNEMLYLFAASDVTMQQANPDEDEHIELMEMKVSAAWQLILDGKVRDAKTIAGVGLLFAKPL